MVILTVSMAGLACGEPDAKGGAVVSSLTPEEIRDFEANPHEIREYLEYALELTSHDLSYQFGSCTPSSGGMDCSGTVQHILVEKGHKAPRQSDSLYLWVRENGNLREVSGASGLDDPQLEHLKPGDLLFWEGTYDTGKRWPATSHVMIFLGTRASDGKAVMVGASSGRYYDGKPRHGVSVFDFQMPRQGSTSKFVGYGPVPGVKSLGMDLPVVAQPADVPPVETKPAVEVVARGDPPPVRGEMNPVSDGSPKGWGAGQFRSEAKAVDSVTGKPWRYLVYLPEQYGESEGPMPVILYLHGRSSRGENLDQVKAYGPPSFLDRRKDFRFVVISPQLPDGSWPAASLTEFLDEVVREYGLDRNRVYLTGVSLGAMGAWELAGASPDRFAALAPVAAHGGSSLASKLTEVPVWGFHGAQDDIVSIEPHRKLIGLINSKGGSARLTEFPDGTHGNIISPVYAMEALYDWFLEQRRPGL